MMARRAATLLVLLAACVGGCPPSCPEDYSGCPELFLSLADLAAMHNANAAKVSRLWARAQVRVTLPSGVSLDVPSSLLMLSKAKAGEEADFVLMGHELSLQLFRAGVDAADGLYYFWHNIGDDGQAWVGRCRLAGAPGVGGLPLDPMGMLAVLGVSELPPIGPGAMPTAVMRLQGKPPAYVVRYVKPQPVTGELKVWREVSCHWSDSLPARPFRVRLFDADGLCRVVADVGEYRPIEWEGPAAETPVMPTHVNLCWPEIKGVQQASSLRMVLSEMSTTHAFSEKVFDFESNLPAGVPMTYVDAAYGPGGPERPSP